MTYTIQKVSPDETAAATAKEQRKTPPLQDKDSDGDPEVTKALQSLTLQPLACLRFPGIKKNTLASEQLPSTPVRIAYASTEVGLADALLKQGVIKIVALQTLIGAQSHRKQILGELMLLCLLTRSNTAIAIKDSTNATRRDLVLQGHSELAPFIVRCHDCRQDNLC